MERRRAQHAERHASVKAEALEWLRAQGAAFVDEALAARLLIEFPKLTPRRAREVCIESGLALAPMVELVRQDSFAHLERTLGALAEEYERGNRARRGQVRQAVIIARRHALWTLKNPHASEAKHAEKREMALWLLTWLENPPLFAEWARLRAKTLRQGGETIG